MTRNARLFHDKFREPFVELLVDGLRHFELTTMEADAAVLAHWTEQAKELDVAPEIESALRELPAGASVAVSCGWLSARITADPASQVRSGW